jgi:hypothetical protein
VWKSENSQSAQALLTMTLFYDEQKQVPKKLQYKNSPRGQTLASAATLIDPVTNKTKTNFFIIIIPLTIK